jgi:regulator of replication initiation timing
VNIQGLDSYTNEALAILSGDIAEYAKTNAVLWTEVNTVRRQLASSEAARADLQLEIEVLRDGLSAEDLAAVKAELEKRRAAKLEGVQRA